LYRLLEVCGIRLPILLVGAGFPSRLARRIKKGSYDWVLPIEQHSLYCAWRALRKFPKDFSKLVYYSLEIQTPADPDVNSQMRRMLGEERRILHHIGGIIIQDVNRLKVLGDDLLQFIPIVHLLPLFSDRPAFTERSNVLRETLGISESKRILLYFGAFYAERMIDGIVREFCDARRKDVVLVLHNPQMTSEEAGRLESMGQGVIASTRFLSEDDLDRLVASADMGIALYDNDKPNTRYTAFSSEKVTTYLRCGIPFIAFDNESFRELSDGHDCCALIVSIGELGKAMDRLLSNHAHYAREAQLAYRRIFYRTEVNLGVAPELRAETYWRAPPGNIL
jgi:glycosyltransferase involved in cell wall biosynthesis